MHIYIPSRSREWMLYEGTLRHIPPGMATIVVPESQMEIYRATVRDQYEIIGISDDIRIAAKRHEIGRIAQARGQPRFMMMDDDLELLIRRSDEVWNLRKMEGARELVQALSWLTMIMSTDSRVTHAGFSPREGNNHFGVGGVLETADRNTRLMRAYAWDTETFLSLEHGRVSLMEDFDLSLQSLRQGGESVVLGYYASGQRTTNDPGGCSDYRTLELHNSQAEELRRLHPNFVTLRNKVNQSGSLAVRREVTISWKRAADEGARKRSKR